MFFLGDMKRRRDGESEKDAWRHGVIADSSELLALDSGRGIKTAFQHTRTHNLVLTANQVTYINLHQGRYVKKTK